MPNPAPQQDCPDHEDCFANPTEIGHVCDYGPICGTCIVYKVQDVARGLLAGTCRLRTDRGLFPCTAPICDSYMARAGALRADGSPGENRERIIPLKSARARAQPAPAQSIAVAPARTPNRAVGELDMTTDELKALIREAMDEERGGATVPLAGKWEGGSLVIKAGKPDLAPKEIPIDTLLRKVVMVRDRLRVLEQKINAAPKFSDAERVELQSYITKCYGSLTTFNVLFRDESDKFVGEKGKEDGA